MSEHGSKGNISRRSLLKMGGIAAVGALGASALSACAPKSRSAQSSSSSKSQGSGSAPDGYFSIDDWLGEPPDLGKPDQTKDCDIVVAGGGNAGIQAALAAAEGGAKVIVLETAPEETRKVKGEDVGHINSQWLIDQGYGPFDVGEVTHEFVRRSGGHVNPEILRKFVANSGEMFDHTASLVHWPDSRIRVTEGADPNVSPMDSSQLIVQVPGAVEDGPVTYPIESGGWKTWPATAQFMGPLQHNPQQGVAKFSRLDEFQQFALLQSQDLGAEWDYQTTAQKLLQDDSGKVIGIVAKNDDGQVIQYNTSIGVILCTGDYAGNGDMIWNLNPVISERAMRHGEGRDDVKGFSTCDGQGQKMGCWAGGHMESLPRPVMGTPGAAGGGGPWGCTPYLWINADGKRYCNEASMVTAAQTTDLQPDGLLCTITDANWYDVMKKASLDHGAPNYGRPVYFQELQEDMKNVPVGDKNGGMCRTCTIAERMPSTVLAANSIEELADLMGYEGDAKQTLIQTVESYNKMCENQDDTQFGKDSKYMQAIDTPPYYGCVSQNAHKENVGLVTLAGLETDDNLQVVKDDGTPIGGLWAAGNCLGGRYGAGYATPFAGNSIGMAMTHGRVAGKLATGQQVS